MRAFKLARPGVGEIQEIDKPVPSDGEVLIQVEAAGICHSDLHILNQDHTWPFYGTTLGHETAGTIVALGPGAQQFNIGDRVLVRAIWSCGECHACRTDRENACTVAGTRTQFPVSPGIVVDGGLADYMVANQRHLTAIGTLDAPLAATLADAGMTPMHNVNTVRPWLTGPESVVVIIGVGGLGHVALQILAADDNPPTIIAVDVSADKRHHALAAGASAAASPDELAALVAERTGGAGVDVVLDFVGNDKTLAARGRTRRGGALTPHEIPKRLPSNRSTQRAPPAAVCDG